jgi:hypothetical protein
VLDESLWSLYVINLLNTLANFFSDVLSCSSISLLLSLSLM